MFVSPKHISFNVKCYKRIFRQSFRIHKKDVKLDIRNNKFPSGEANKIINIKTKLLPVNININFAIPQQCFMSHLFHLLVKQSEEKKVKAATPKKMTASSYLPSIMSLIPCVAHATETMNKKKPKKFFIGIT